MKRFFPIFSVIAWSSRSAPAPKASVIIIAAMPSPTDTRASSERKPLLRSESTMILN